MSSLKPNKPNTFKGRRDELEVRAWLYQVKQYLFLVAIDNSTGITEDTKVNFASTFLEGTAAAWWYTLVGSNSVPTTWDDFEKAVINEFVPLDSNRRSRDKLRKLVQKTSVSQYLTEFRNIVLMITDMSEGEKVDRFTQGLKRSIRLEVMKAGATTMADASRIALNVDSALFGAGLFRSFNSSPSRTEGYAPMEIGNFEQRDKDRNNNACFKCHKVGCRPWKCGKGKDGQVKKQVRFAKISHTSVQGSNGSSENE